MLERDSSNGFVAHLRIKSYAPLEVHCISATCEPLMERIGERLMCSLAPVLYCQ